MSSRDKILYRNREKYIAHKNRCRRRNYKIGTKGCYIHNWTKQEDQLVLCFNGTDRELSKKIKHSVQAIQSHRSRLKKEIQEGIEKI